MAGWMRTGGPAGINHGGRTKNGMPFEEKSGLTREYFVDFSLFIGVRWASSNRRPYRDHCGELFPRVGFIVTNLRWKYSNLAKLLASKG
jgi:hypothetical protein